MNEINIKKIRKVLAHIEKNTLRLHMETTVLHKSQDNVLKFPHVEPRLVSLDGLSCYPILKQKKVEEKMPHL